MYEGVLFLTMRPLKARQSRIERRVELPHLCLEVPPVTAMFIVMKEGAQGGATLL